MISPEALARAGGATVTAAQRAELDMLMAAAAELVASGGDPDEVLARAREVARRHRTRVAEAAEADLRSLFERNASDEARSAQLPGEARGAELSKARAYARIDAAGMSEDLSRMGEAMARSAREAYVRESARAAMEARSGLYGREEAVRRAVARMGRQGLSCSEYERRDGTRVRVPVDVGVRMAVRDHAHGRLARQVIDIARETGRDLVEVSSHPGARPSHAEWQGQVYSLSGSGGYPSFYETCRVGDPVDGFGGYNCRHTMGIWREGSRRRWEGPDAPDGYTDDECRRLQARQRRCEAAIRRAKRERALLESQGMAHGEASRALSVAQGRLRELVAANPEVLFRERWREQA